MNRKQIERALRRAIDVGVVSSHDSVGPFGCIVYVEAMFADGDHPVVRLQKRQWSWWLCDQGNTFMRQGVSDVEMSMDVGGDNGDFVGDLRTFVEVLLAVDASEAIKAVSKRNQVGIERPQHSAEG